MTDSIFDQVVIREGTGSVKWDFMEQHLDIDKTGILPMWVSDFDFECPEVVRKALHDRVEHGIFGYSDRDKSYYQSVIKWFEDHHNLHLKREWFTTVEGVVPGIAILIQLLTIPGDHVVVQGPYYGSFAKIIKMNSRELLVNPLKESESGYQLDLDNLKSTFEKFKPPVMIFCNPHNPTGRCWSRDELGQLMEICIEHDVTVISDEIWSDLILPDQTFTSMLHLKNEWHEKIITASSASKTFGLSSVRISNILIPDNKIRHQFTERLNAHGLDVFNALSMVAATAAYRFGGKWYNELRNYLAENRQWFQRELEISVPWCKMSKAEGTYLAWLDCRALSMEDSSLKQALLQKSKIVASMGVDFGEQGKGYIRINLGCPRVYLQRAINGLAQLTPQVY
ncbi:aminotransferase [Enterobacterales bacterium CwR94]|nr:aminotransferase [Enterobacterales bacterium CwR94]